MCKTSELVNTGRGVAQQLWSWRCVSQHERFWPRPKAEVPTSTQERATSSPKTLQDEHYILENTKLHHTNGRQTTTRRNGRAREHR